MTEWFYEDSGQSRGPVKKDELRTMLADGLLPATTRVWRDSYGQEWRTAAEAGFTTRPGKTPPPIGPATARPAPPPVAATATASAASGYAAPATSYSPTYTNLIAAVPVIIMGLEMVVLAAGVSPYNPAFERSGGR